MTLTTPHTMLPDLLADLSDPGLLLQMLAIVACLGAGWLLSRLMVSMLVVKGERLVAMRARVDSFLHVLSPLISLLLLAIAIPVVGRWQHVGLIRVALPLVSSYLLIRLVFFLLRRIFAKGCCAAATMLPPPAS